MTYSSFQMFSHNCTWLAARDGAEDFRAFCDRTSDHELGVLVGREPARAREKEAEAA